MKLVKRNGFTLIELMVAIFIMALVSVPMYYLLKDSANKRALVASRDFIKQEANKVLKILENDLSQARKGTFKQVSDDVVAIKVRKPGNKEADDVSLSYLYVKPDLIRRFEGKEWLVCRYVEDFAVNPAIDGAGRLVVSLKVKTGFDGLKEEEEPEYSQEKLIVMREDSSDELDKFWRDVGDVNKFFATQGSLMAGVKDDAKKLVQDFTGTFVAAGGDISAMTVGEILKVRDQLMGGLKDIQSSMGKLDTEILGLSADALFDRNWLGKMSDDKKEKAQRVREALAGMKNKGDLNWKKITSLGGSGGMFSSGMKTGAIKEMYNAKAELFNSGQEVVKQLQDFKKNTDNIANLDLTGIDLKKWGL